MELKHCASRKRCRADKVDGHRGPTQWNDDEVCCLLEVETRRWLAREGRPARSKVGKLPVLAGVNEPGALNVPGGSSGPATFNSVALVGVQGPRL